MNIEKLQQENSKLAIEKVDEINSNGTDVETVYINTEKIKNKPRDFKRRSKKLEIELKENRMECHSSIFNVNEKKGYNYLYIQNIVASFTTKSGLYVKRLQDEQYAYHHFPSSILSVEGIKVAENFHSGTADNFKALRDEEITKPGAHGGRFQRDAEAGGIDIMEEKQSIKNQGKNQVLHFNINQSSCNDCTKKIKDLAIKYPLLKFSFNFGGKYHNDKRNADFEKFVEDNKSKIVMKQENNTFKEAPGNYQRMIKEMYSQREDKKGRVR
ncbi:hypothetical protein [Wolbachia endosymbiont of Chironomus riparius]|uniref:hypothetical protein n=1 Tax=Wolbachia endosymbiont of Chironomus riparius TaxID=2883238 RepID=UPI0020A09129|nr:hypothetical protein [Wolbachia endosymbiont of Chironomus riparius]